jgi:hypothetical protein
MPPEREQFEKGGCQIESKNQYAQLQLIMLAMQLRLAMDDRDVARDREGRFVSSISTLLYVFSHPSRPRIS